MNTFREAVHEYLSMRRNLGFKLREAGNALLDFANFMEQHQAPFITETLAFAWAQQPENVRPARWAQRLGDVRVFARYCKATDPRKEVPSPGTVVGYGRGGESRMRLSQRFPGFPAFKSVVSNQLQDSKAIVCF